jgi:hypothetical protein
MSTRSIAELPAEILGQIVVEWYTALAFAKIGVSGKLVISATIASKV